MSKTPQTKPATPTTSPSPDLQIKDAAVIFTPLWQELEAEFGRENLRFPKEFILLGGAPGAGKGTNTEFIAKSRGLTCAPIVMSSLLDTPEMQRLKAAGSLIGDREVLGVLLRQLLRREYRDGVILDGFPRTKVQVECLKMLHEKMTQLWREFYGTPLGIHFRQPIIHIVLSVGEPEISSFALSFSESSASHVCSLNTR